MKVITKALTFSCLLTLSFLPSVHAGPMVTDWGFQLESGFSSFSDSSDANGSNISGSNINAYWSGIKGYDVFSTLSWGTGNSGSSSLDIAGGTLGSTNGALSTNGAAVDTVTFTHQNNPINGATLTKATLEDKIWLTPTDPSPFYDGAVPLEPPPLTFDILFKETLNSGPAASCDVITSPTPCNDIFVIDIEGAGFNTVTKAFEQIFPYAGHLYSANIFMDGIDVLADNVCTVAGAAAGCLGVTTVEGGENTFQISLSITHLREQIPEPSTLAIFALGLLGLVYRRHNNN